ncbi:MAG: endonuclease III [Longimicrobiales bacterium]|nr:endonuclease III [Longimicrobiales bacterium]
MSEGGGRKTRKTPAGRRFVGETKAEKRERVEEVIRRLWEEYPDATTSLRHESPYELLVATILSAQCTDERVNMVTPDLFERYPTPEDLADADPEDVQEIIHSTGFYRQKTKSLIGMAQSVVEDHGGEVPDTMKELTKLRGVGRKTANVVLGNAFEKDEGVVVDTHVKRISGRLGLTKETTPEKIEQDLMELVPEDAWTDLPHLFIFHGRAVCKAPTPLCSECVLVDLCPSADVG